MSILKYLIESLTPEESITDIPNVWYHGSDKVVDKLKSSVLLNLDYKTESGVWLTSDKIQASMYGKHITTWDVSILKLKDNRTQTKQMFIVDSLIKLGYNKEEAIDAIRKEDSFVEASDIAYLRNVDQKGFDGIVLRGEFDKGFDLWINDSTAIYKLQRVAGL